MHDHQWWLRSVLDRLRMEIIDAHPPSMVVKHPGSFEHGNHWCTTTNHGHEASWIVCAWKSLVHNHQAQLWSILNRWGIVSIDALVCNIIISHVGQIAHAHQCYWVTCWCFDISWSMIEWPSWYVVVWYDCGTLFHHLMIINTITITIMKQLEF